MLYNDEQIRMFADDFISQLESGEIKKSYLPNEENLYYGTVEERDLQAVLNTNPSSPLFTMSFDVNNQPKESRADGV